MAEAGEKKKGRKLRGWFVVAVVIAVFVILGAQGGGESGSSSQTTSSDTTAAEETQDSTEESGSTEESESTKESKPTEKYTITDEEVDTSNPYDYEINGILTNNSGRDCSYIQITYVLYDADGNQVGNAYANTSELKAGGTWKFSAGSLVSPDEVASYELSEVTGF